MATDISICNSALYLIGAEAINSFEDGTREARLCAALYPTTYESILQQYPWSFSLQQIDLARTTETPLIDWEYSYQIPGNVLRILRKDQLRNDYELYLDKLFSNDDKVTIIAQVKPSEADIPAHLVRTLEFAMAEILAASVQQDQAMAQMFKQMYKDQLILSRSIDAQNKPSFGIPEGKLIYTAVRSQGGQN